MQAWLDAISDPCDSSPMTACIFACLLVCVAWHGMQMHAISDTGSDTIQNNK